MGKGLTLNRISQRGWQQKLYCIKALSGYLLIVLLEIIVSCSGQVLSLKSVPNCGICLYLGIGIDNTRREWYSIDPASYFFEWEAL